MNHSRLVRCMSQHFSSELTGFSFDKLISAGVSSAWQSSLNAIDVDDWLNSRRCEKNWREPGHPGRQESISSAQCRISRQ